MSIILNFTSSCFVSLISVISTGELQFYYIYNIGFCQVMFDLIFASLIIVLNPFL